MIINTFLTNFYENQGAIPRSAPIVIGTQQSGHTDEDCDFLCTGINDQIIINQAIEAGSSILMLSGTYNISSPIIILDYTHIEGLKGSSILNVVDWQDTQNVNVIWTKGAKFTTIKDITIKMINTSTLQLKAIYIDESSYAIINGCHISGFSSSALGGGIYSWRSSNVLIYNNHVQEMTGTSINMSANSGAPSSNCIISNNIIENSLYSINGGGYMSHIVIEGNIVRNCGYGIRFLGSDNIACTGNVIDTITNINGYGLSIGGISSNYGINNVVTGNIVRYTIASGAEFSYSQRCIFSGNVLENIGQSGIVMRGNIACIVSGNLVTNFGGGGEVSNSYGITEGTSCLGNNISSNLISNISSSSHGINSNSNGYSSINGNILTGTFSTNAYSISNVSTNMMICVNHAVTKAINSSGANTTNVDNKI